MCGALRLADAGKKAVLMGWVNRRRDLGQIIFVDLRDRTGVTQVVFSAELTPPSTRKPKQLRNEFVIAAIGTVNCATPIPSIRTYLPAKSNWSSKSCAF